MDPVLTQNGGGQNTNQKIHKQNWDNCSLTKHFWRHHQGDMENAISNLQVTLVDHLTGPYREEKLLQLEKDWILNMALVRL